VTVTSGSDYKVRFTGLDVVVKDGETITLTVKVDGKLPEGDTTETITLTFNANCVRVSDAAGITSYEPSDSLSTRSFTVKTGDTGALEGSVNTDSPEAGTVMVSETATTEDVVLDKSGAYFFYWH